MNIYNPILNTDSYKASQWLQYPPNTSSIFSYIESRGGKYPETELFGLQMFLKEYLSRPITKQDIDEAEVFWKAHGEPFNRSGWERLLEKYDGKMPVTIRAVPEGTIVPNGNVLVTVENTDSEFFWLTSYIETALLRAVWYPTTVATNSWTSKQIIKRYLEETGDVSGLSFKLHDFGARGVSSFESAGIGGAAHLVNFMGSDTVTGILYAMKYYNSASVVGFSIPASEHSTITSWGKLAEVDAYNNMLEQFGGEDVLLACVSDSYDIYNAVENLWGGELRQKVLDMGGTLVIRPDSGTPSEVVLETVRLLDQQFGSEINNKGYKVLNPVVRVIQGDGITSETISEILEVLRVAGYSADNIAFGQGGALLQQVDRDTNKFAMKASAACVDGEWIDVYKDPITDSGKTSKKGRITLYRDESGAFVTDRINAQLRPEWTDVLVDVFRNGQLLKDYSFDEVRANSEK